MSEVFRWLYDCLTSVRLRFTNRTYKTAIRGLKSLKQIVFILVFGYLCFLKIKLHYISTNHMNNLKNNATSWTWQRVFSAAFATAGTVSTLLFLGHTIVTGTWPSSTTIWICFVVSPFGSYLFGCYAWTGVLPKFMLGQNSTDQSSENRR